MDWSPPGGTPGCQNLLHLPLSHCTQSPYHIFANLGIPKIVTTVPKSNIGDYSYKSEKPLFTEKMPQLSFWQLGNWSWLPFVLWTKFPLYDWKYCFTNARQTLVHMGSKKVVSPLSDNRSQLHPHFLLTDGRTIQDRQTALNVLCKTKLLLHLKLKIVSESMQCNARLLQTSWSML